MWFPKPMHLYTRRHKSHLSNSCFPFIFRCRSWEETNISKPGFDVFPAFDDRSSFSVANWSTQWWYNFISRFQFNQRNTLIKRYPLDSKKGRSICSTVSTQPLPAVLQHVPNIMMYLSPLIIYFHTTTI